MPTTTGADPDAAIIEEATPVTGAERGRRGDAVAAVVATALTAGVAIAAVLLLPPLVAGGILIGLALLYLTRALVFSWTGLLMAFVSIVMFIPIRRYALPIPLPFALEPYRFIIVVMLVAITVALLIDPTFRWRPIRFGWPIGIFYLGLFISIALNGPVLAEQGLMGGSLGALVNLSLMVSVLFIVRQLLRTERIVMAMLMLISFSGAVVGLFAMIEKVTHVNVFLRLNTFLPLVLLRDEGTAFRAGGARAFGSSQHPIALAVMLCMLLPIAIYLAKYAGWPRNPINRKIVFFVVVLLTLLGVLAAISRTAVVVMAVMFVVTLVFRPRLAGLLAAVAVPLLVAGSFILPKVVDTLVGSFLNVDTLIASQYTSAGMTGAGRLADLDPALAEAAANPFFGTGLGSRIVIGVDHNAFILDNQVLGSLLETGAVGVIGLAALMLVPAIMLVAFAFRSGAAPRHAALAFTIAVSASGYTAGLFFYDAFGFMQTFLLLCTLLAVGAWVLTEAPRDVSRPVSVSRETVPA